MDDANCRIDARTVAILSGEGAGLDRRIDTWMRTHAPPGVDLKSAIDPVSMSTR